MRKINLSTTINPKTYAPGVLLRIKDGDDLLEFKEEMKSDPHKFTPEQQCKIDTCNELLTKNKQDVMTEMEEEYFIEPNPVKDPSSEELQALSGFSVEKKITYK